MLLETMTNLEDFVTHMREEEEIGKLAKTREQDPRADEKDKADKELRKRAYETLKDISAPGIDYSRETPETIGEDHVNQGINLRAGMARQDSAKILKDNTDDLLNSLKQESLEEIALTEPIVKKGDKGYEELLSLYGQYFAAKDLVERYKKGQVHDPREIQTVRTGGAKKAEKEMREKLKNKGYSKDLQDIAGNIANLAVRDNYVNEQYVRDNADELFKEAEKKFRDYEKDQGKKVIDYVKSSVKNMIKGDAEEFNTARALAYQVTKK